MARLILSDRQRDALERLRSQTSQASVFRNATIILHTAAGQSKGAVAQALGCSTATVDRARRLYRRGGLDALRPVKPPGRPSRATPAYRAALAKAVGAPPQSLGYGFSTWSVPRLAAHLKKVTKVGFGEDQTRRLLRQEGF